MKRETVVVLFEDYKDYQANYKKELGWDMKETFPEYIQRCIDIGELNDFADVWSEA
tara:strand:- start:657 stop:824 length:168 start_codon:yes stop_codon:yes gene_type:complete